MVGILTLSSCPVANFIDPVAGSGYFFYDLGCPDVGDPAKETTPPLIAPAVLDS